MITRIRAAWAALRGQPVAYRLVVAQGGIKAKPAVLAECEVVRRPIGFRRSE